MTRRSAIGALAAMCLLSAGGSANAALLSCVIPGGSRTDGPLDGSITTSTLFVDTDALSSPDWRPGSIRGELTFLFAGPQATVTQTGAVIQVSKPFFHKFRGATLRYTLSIDTATGEAAIVARASDGDRTTATVEWRGRCASVSYAKRDSEKRTLASQ
ncbi:MAG: hypothetical protein ACHP7N_14405 [Caulobacterales bacterium]